MEEIISLNYTCPTTSSFSHTWPEPFLSRLPSPCRRNPKSSRGIGKIQETSPISWIISVTKFGRLARVLPVHSPLVTEQTQVRPRQACSSHCRNCLHEKKYDRRIKDCGFCIYMGPFLVHDDWCRTRHQQEYGLIHCRGSLRRVSRCHDRDRKCLLKTNWEGIDGSSTHRLPLLLWSDSVSARCLQYNL